MKSDTPNTAPSSPESLHRDQPAFGWTPYAEQINGRFAMIGFVGLLLLEILTGQGLLSWLGIR
jgi:hypothetical protein